MWNLLAKRHLRNELFEVTAPDSEISLPRSSQEEGDCLRVFGGSHGDGLDWVLVDLDYFVNLATEVVDEIEEAIFSGDKHLGCFPDLDTTLGVGDKFETGDWVVECLASGSVVEGDQLAGEEVVLHFEKPDVLFATPHQTRVDCIAESETHEVEVGELAGKQFDFLEFGQLCESIYKD